MNTSIKSHRDLEVWKKAMCLTNDLYDVADEFPARENFGLWSQLTRSGVSVPVNIAEGKSRGTAKDFAHFLTNSRASLAEIDTLLLVAANRKYVQADKLNALMKQVDEVGRMLNGLRRSILERK